LLKEGSLHSRGEQLKPVKKIEKNCIKPGPITHSKKKKGGSVVSVETGMDYDRDLKFCPEKC